MTKKISILAVIFALFLSPCLAIVTDCSNNLYLDGGCDFKTNELTVLWQISLSSSILFSPVSLSTDMLVCTTEKSVAMADPSTGKLRWEYKLPTGCRWNAAISGNNSIIAFGLSDMVCLKTTSGQKLWSQATALPITAQPVYDQEKVFVPTGKSIVAFDNSNGNKVWEKGFSGLVSTTPCVFDKKVYVATNDGCQIALNVSDGSVVWECKTGENSTDVLVASEKHIYLTSEKSLYAIDRLTGKPIWKFLAKSDAFAPSVSDKYLFYPSADGSLYCLDAMTCGKGCCLASAKQMWSLNTNSKYSGRVTVSSNYIYVTSTNGWIFKVDSNNGDILARFPTGYDLSKTVFSKGQVIIPYGKNLLSISDIPESIKLYVDKPILGRGDFLIYTDAGAKVINGKSMVPARTVLEPFGGITTWSQSDKTVTCLFEGKKLEITIGQPTAKMNNVVVPIDSDRKVTAVISSGRVMIPARFLAQQFMGMSLIWNANERSFEIKRSAR